ncbi:substrate-binding periplasmic protein [Agarivorans sp. MS3-6]|uniref:substrate-binding periplasmic protein n=1 Tax=Agarivorans sp. TSD2052 TaxID=2937286 RepID=UPI00200FB468|nr:transporter substrate-binding domain-containing protein [Agarivorans sp. TSD2052]UPW18998.1 transporter substrate-binding domain-containing protein [Agarivorans sp. TSD2052]
MKGIPDITVSAVCIALSLMSFSSASQDNQSIVIATTPAAGSAAGPFFNHQQQLAKRPGYRAQLLLQAGERCHADINFLIVPWKRALALVEHGGADAAFSSSYKAERAVYGAYPMKNGKPDTYRAIRGYSYLLFTHKNSDLSWDGKKISGAERKIAVERGSAGVDIVKSHNLDPVELTDESQMLDMLAAKRVDGMVAIDGNVEAVIALDPLLARQIKAQQPPLQSKHGYLMFSKAYYLAHTTLSECVWNAVGDIRASADYKALVKSYNNGQ